MNATADWSTDTVLQRLAATAGEAPVAVQVFLGRAETDEPLDAQARRLVDAAKRAAGPGGGTVEIRKLHPRARAFSVSAGLPVLRAIAGQPGVRSILPNELPELLIAPVATRLE